MTVWLGELHLLRKIPLIRFFLIGKVEVSHKSQQLLLRTLVAPGAKDAPATGTRHPGGTGQMALLPL